MLALSMGLLATTIFSAMLLDLVRQPSAFSWGMLSGPSTLSSYALHHFG